MPKVEKVSRKPSIEKFGKLKKTFGPRKPSAPLGPSCNVSLCPECKFLKILKEVLKKTNLKLERKGEVEKLENIEESRTS